VREDFPNDSEPQSNANGLSRPPLVKVCPRLSAEMAIKKNGYRSFNDVKCEIAKEKRKYSKETAAKHQTQRDCITETTNHPNDVRDGNRHRHGRAAAGKA
jgi:hypothetical protein